MRAVIYMRVSTQDQNLDNQRIRLLDYCEYHGWEVVNEYSDKISGLKDHRPGLDQLLKDARKRKFDITVAVKLDRMGRSTQHLLLLVEELHNYGIDIAFTDQPINTSDHMGKFIFTILGAVAEFERSLISERTKSGIERAKKQGKIIGRPKIMIPYEIKEKVITLRNEGNSLRKISFDTNISIRQISKILNTE